MKAFYFAKEDRKLRYDDGREIVVGETHTVDCKPSLCNRGLHASKRIIDALTYAPGPILYLVELSGDIDKGDDKSCATNRTYLEEFDATGLLRVFSRKLALINIEKIKPYCSEEDYELITSYLNSSDENIKLAAESAESARSAAESAESAVEAAVEAAAEAAKSAAWSAESARSAARSAAWSARSAAESARSAAWSARSAASTGAWSARSAAESARSAAWSARSAAESAESAAESAARSAEAAAWLAADEMLIDMIRKETGWDV